MFDARIKLLAFVLICSTLIGLTRAQEFVANYDESKVPDYTLPPIIDSQDSGESFQTAWKLRRKELLDTFSQHMFGYQPKSSFQLKCEKLESGPSVGGKALRQQYRVSLGTDAGSQVIHLLVFTPANSSGPVPCFLGLNFRGNHTVAADPEIVVTQSWSPNDAKVGATNNTASEAGRGAALQRIRRPRAQTRASGGGVFRRPLDASGLRDLQEGLPALQIRFREPGQQDAGGRDRP